MTPHLRTAEGGTLILGGGFAGAYVARGLGRQGATIVNPATFMLYTPLLPDAAAGSIEPRHVTVPLRTMCPHADLLLGRAVSLEPDRKVVRVCSEAGEFAVGYERLVVALGSITSTPAVPGLRGVAANPMAGQLGLPLDARGRIPVDELLRVNGMDDVLALGDIAAVPNEATGELDPPTCRHALRQARRLSRNLRGILGWTVARGYHLMALPFVARRMNLAIANANWVLAGHSTWFYNPIAAVPSLHCGFAMALGIAVAAAGLAITAVGHAIAARPRVVREVAYA